jgi:hypothetical protein
MPNRATGAGYGKIAIGIYDQTSARREHVQLDAALRGGEAHRERQHVGVRQQERSRASFQVAMTGLTRPSRLVAGNCKRSAMWVRSTAEDRAATSLRVIGLESALARAEVAQW